MIKDLDILKELYHSVQMINIGARTKVRSNNEMMKMQYLA